MAVGDGSDMLGRLKSLIPGGWFASVAPLRDAVLGGLGDSLAWIYALLGAARLQTRLASATGYFLDLAAYDYLGLGLLRRPIETDDLYRARIVPEILRERATRTGLIEAVEILTGKPPIVIELFSTGDCGAWDVGTFAWADNGTPGAPLSGWDASLGAWDVAADFAFVAPTAAIAPSGGAGCWGSTSEPFEVFLTVYRPVGQGTPVVAGYDTFAGGFDTGAIEWTSSDPSGTVTDDDIYASIAATAAAGVTVWVAIINADGATEAPPVPGSFDFSLDGNAAIGLL